MGQYSRPQTTPLDAASVLACAAGGVVVVGTVAVLGGWILGSVGGTRLWFSPSPMLMTTALAFLCLGVAMSVGDKRVTLSRAFALAAALIATTAVIQHVTSGWLDFEYWLRHLTRGGPLVGGRMAFPTAAVVATAALGLWCSFGPSRSGVLLLIGISGATLVVYGLNILSGQLTGLDTVPLIGGVTWFASHTAAAALLVGAGLVARACYLGRRSAPAGPGWLPFLVGGSALTVGLSLWLALDSNNHGLVRHAVESRLGAAREAIDRDIAANARVLRHMSLGWRELPSAAWDLSAQAYIHESLDHLALAWADSSGRVRWVAAREQTARLSSLELGADLSAATALQGFGRLGVRLGRADHLVGRPSLLILVPTYEGARATGALLALYDLRLGCELFLQPYEAMGVGFVASSDGEVLYRTRELSAHVPPMLELSIETPLGGRELTLLAVPTALAVQVRNNSLPRVTLVLIALVAALMTAMAWLGQRSFRRMYEAEGVSDDLLDALVERDLARAAHARQEALLRGILETMSEGVIAADRGGDILVSNRAAERLLGTRGTAAGEAGAALLYRPGEEQPCEPDELPLALAIEGHSLDEDYVVWSSADDGRRWVSVSARPLAAPRVGVDGGLVVLRDITERKLGEETLWSMTRELDRRNAELSENSVRLQRSSEELSRSNRELTEFASVASHDLRAPLRTVRSFVDLLEEEYGTAFDATARDYLRRIRAAVARMNALVEGLLSLARVRTGAEPFTSVDLNAVAREVLNDLSAAIADRGACVAVDALPTLDADRLQMHQLLQNLIGNALKFVPADVTPHVTVCATEGSGWIRDSDTWELRVRDNGIGFDPSHAVGIFKPFERLHGASEYEGCGLGLAVCARIVERHGGTIRAEGQLGSGASFIVRLPARHAVTAPAAVTTAREAAS